MKKLVLIVIALCFFYNGFSKDSFRGWTLDATSTKNYVGSPVANGRIGIVPWSEPFSVNRVVLNHVFDRESPRGISKVLLGINPFNLELSIDKQKITKGNIEKWHQRIDMKKAVHTTTFVCEGGSVVKYDIRALRNMPYSGSVTVTITPKKDVDLHVENPVYIPNEYKSIASGYRDLRDGEVSNPIFENVAESTFGGQKIASTSSFLFSSKETPQVKEIGTQNSNINRVGFDVKLHKGVEYTFTLVANVCTTRDFTDPYGEAERMGVFAQMEGVDKLVDQHEKLWNDLWESDIIIEGDLEAQRDVRFALYNLYSFAAEGTRLSYSPMGLSSQGYNGHVFWDTELWMYPPMLLMHPEIAKSLLDYRSDRLDAAHKKAYQYGYDGAMFPWESDDSGEEATPSWCLTGTFEQHITADIGIAFWNYYRLTHDKKWLESTGYPMLKEIADFWVSRVTKNNDNTYSIENVVGADEFAHSATDNAFTNGSVKEALQFANKAAEVLGKEENAEWEKVEKGLKILSFDNGVTKEHATYNGEIIKQADANLLAYPLGLIQDASIIKKDLQYYEPKIDKAGPAMTFSVFAVLYSRMGDGDKAYEMFHKGFMPNKRAPFGVLAESAVSQNPYFATGAGGLLQAVINGFGGLQLTDKGIVQLESSLPSHWKKLIIKGVGPKKETFIVEK